MTLAELTDQDIATLAQKLRDKGAPFAIATVVRTLGLTAAKPGAKALLSADGTIQQGWIGGGCVRAALAKAAKRAMAEGTPQLISLHPQEVLAEKGVVAGDDLDGVRFARNGCPSKGSMDIFVEPILPLPELVIFGASPVAQCLAKLGAQFKWSVQEAEAKTAIAPLPDAARRMIVVATQGKDDAASLTSALTAEAEFVAFVGSRRKFKSLSEKLIQAGIESQKLAQVQAPAGLAIEAVTPEEIALSILAQLTLVRRRNHRTESVPDG
ncbi:XdhC family protein [Parasedimentitalea psychrophila]|uniref:XdhC family protein n=1 Tax=Parasedimentitalea psychrophila TaxID=2997337 RepID=A0A9Y2L2W4_9RHOB|nr:XdhC family protein [Parasedimentitalea psychrophila]WIY26577.1 XdhC family protein [Parasedimentitalea psychrophila]